MSSVCIVCVEGVLVDAGDKLPNAFIKPTTLMLVQQLSGRWPIGFVSSAPREVTVAWLKESGAPAAAWVVQSDSKDERAAVMLQMLAQRRDRPSMVFVPDPVAFASLAVAGAIVVTVTHPADFGLGDWRQPSSWDGRGGMEDKFA